MEDGKIEYQMFRVAKLEREVIGQLIGGDAESLEDNLKYAKDYLETMETMQQRIEGSQNEEKIKRVLNTIKGLKRIIRKIGTIDAVKCACCGERVLQSTIQCENGRHLCRSCIAARKE